MKTKLFLLSIILCLSYACSNPGNSPRNTILVTADDTDKIILEKAANVLPSPQQAEALDNEFTAFIHFGPNTFTRMEWGNGMEDPRIFDLKELHTDQWCEAMQAAGMKMAIITVKHHDGFVLWQSRYTRHGIMSTGYKNGEGDILKELAESCRKYGIKLGVYLSPADLFQIESPDGLYGNLSEYSLRTIPREVPGRPFKNKTTFEFEADDYNEYFLNQLFELLTEYGPIDEVWFDGAHPKRKGGQRYNYTAWRQLIRALVPNAVIFGREDIRWCGNEGGQTRETEWNVIPYKDDPNTMTEFADLTDMDLGSRKALFNYEKPYYLHYQPAETNTSIRAGWFYRDDDKQGVRSADDVFDIYERSVGGNSIFLLNIPPNREGKFPGKDVAVLREVGKRIKETYGTDLLKKAKGPKKVLDNKSQTYVLLDKEPREIIITTPQAITINRITIREAITSVGERVEKHAIDAFIDGKWQEIAQATNIGHKRILRFPEVTTDQLRLRILESRFDPAISEISAHYYQTHPPILGGSRSPEGFVKLEPKSETLNWNRNNQNSAGNLNLGYAIYYTTDGSKPNANSNLYTEPFFLERGEVQAVAILNNETGPLYREEFGIIKKDWKILKVSGERESAKRAFDENPLTYWMSEEEENHFISIDLGEKENIQGFAYTPQIRNSRGMIEEGVFEISSDGRNWKEVEKFTFGNLINDPTKRRHDFRQAVQARYVRIKALTIAGDDTVATMAELDLY